MKQTQLVIMDEVGLHARPAALFCALAAKYKSAIKIRNISTNSKTVNAKSILSILTLGVKQGHRVEINAEGDDELEAVNAIQGLVENNFQE